MFTATAQNGPYDAIRWDEDPAEPRKDQDGRTRRLVRSGRRWASGWQTAGSPWVRSNPRLPMRYGTGQSPDAA